MERCLLPIPPHGTVEAMPSKSQTQRLLLCAALGDAPCAIRHCGGGRDLESMLACIRGLGARVTAEADTVTVVPGKPVPHPLFPCGESAAVLRFLLPVAAALGLEAEFRLSGSLPGRPLEPLLRALTAHGAEIAQPDSGRLLLRGSLEAGDYTLPGDLSSQFVSGLLLALPLLEGQSTLTILPPLYSAPYVTMTTEVQRCFGVTHNVEGLRYSITHQNYVNPETLDAEGDWSNAAVWLCAGALGRGVTVTGLNLHSVQGDRVILRLLRVFGAAVEAWEDRVTVRPGRLRGTSVDAGDIPDLVPALAVVAAAAEGETEIFHAARLRGKESDRLYTTAALLRGLGTDVQETADGLRIRGGTRLTGGVADSFGDHRIAMAAALAASAAQAPVLLRAAEAVDKSDPGFWRKLEYLQGVEDR